MALQTGSYPVLAQSSDDSTDEKTCPENVTALSQQERAKLPKECLADDNNHWGLVMSGIAALAAGTAIGLHNNGGGDKHHSSPVPPDDDTSVTTFSNGVTLDRGADTLHFDNIKLPDGTSLGEATLSYVKQGEQWVLTTSDGKTLLVSGWNVTGANAAVIEGTQQDSGLYWKYDSRGYLILADDQTVVANGNDESHSADRGVDISGNGKTGVIISGDRTSNTLSGDSTVSDGATGIVITGDSTTNTISGHSTIDGATGG